MLLQNLANILAILEVQGTDSKNFLQGQLTNDINLLDDKPFQLSAHLNNKGRILASFIISKIAPDHYYLITSTDLIDSILPRLKMFVLRSKVTITKSDMAIVFSDDRMNFGHILEIAPQNYISITDTIPQNATEKTNGWTNMLINHGIPMIYANTVEAFIPQHVNYDLIDGVNFKKGCYTGQEIVARTHYLGKVKRRTFKFICDFKPTVGQLVCSPKLDNQSVGIIVDCIKRDYNYLGLVSLQTDCTDSAYLDKDNKQQLLIQSIQY